METWMIPTNNDPLGTVRSLILSIWETNQLDSMLLPLNGNVQKTGPYIVNDPDKVKLFNPFIPLLPVNAAQMVPELLESDQRVAAVLRSCEIHTLSGVSKHFKVDTNKLLTISVDCLGTLPADEFDWRAQRKRSPKGLTQEALQFARQGGVVPYRYRVACQICESPAATQADINIGVLGLPVRRFFLLKTKQKVVLQTFQALELESSDTNLLTQHKRVCSRLSERGQDTRRRLFKGLSSVLPENIDSLVEPLHGCDDCRQCFDNCPLCSRDFPGQDLEGQYKSEDVIEWLVSCSECGICEQSCPKKLPLTLIFGHIRDQIESNQRFSCL